MNRNDWQQTLLWKPGRNIWKVIRGRIYLALCLPLHLFLPRLCEIGGEEVMLNCNVQLLKKPALTCPSWQFTCFKKIYGRWGKGLSNQIQSRWRDCEKRSCFFRYRWLLFQVEEAVDVHLIASCIICLRSLVLILRDKGAMCLNGDGIKLEAPLSPGGKWIWKWWSN